MKFFSSSLQLLAQLSAALTIFLASAPMSMAQDNKSGQNESGSTAGTSWEDKNSQSGEDKGRSDNGPAQWIITAVSVIAMGAMIVVVILGLGPLGKRNRADAIRAVAVLFITYCAIILAMTYSYTETITAIASLLSATIGYMYGRSAGDSSSQQQTERAGSDEKSA